MGNDTGLIRHLFWSARNRLSSAGTPLRCMATFCTLPGGLSCEPKLKHQVSRHYSRRGDLVYADTGMSLETPETASRTHNGGWVDAATGEKANSVAVLSRASKLQTVLGNASHALMPR